MSRALHIGGPLLLLALIIAAFFAYKPLRAPFGSTPPPVEKLTVERTVLDDEGIHLRVRADGTQAVTIAQVQVDGAFWQFTQSPPGELPRLSSAWVTIPYPWVEGETHRVTFVTRSGVTFTHEIAVAWPTPQLGATEMGRLTLVGIFLGIVPVALGFLFYPAMRDGGPRVFHFALALTLGLLAFLLVDTLDHALENAAKAAPGLNIQIMVWLVAGLSFLALWAIGRRGGAAPAGAALAWSIALAIGLHNLGEGLAVGSAFASGAAALGGFLLFGFMLHNVTEGIGIAAPMLDGRPRLWLWAGLAALAGLPAVLGVWLGAFAYTGYWAALALAVGVGAILQVIVEVAGLMLRRMRGEGTGYLLTVCLGILAGIGVMYATALLVTA